MTRFERADHDARIDARPDPRPGPGAIVEWSAGPEGRDGAPRPRALHRVLAARAPLAPQAAPVHPRGARRLVALGALSGLLRVTGLGGPRAQPPEPLLVEDRRSDRSLVRDVYRRCRRCAFSAGADDRGDRSRPWRPAGPQGGRASPDRRAGAPLAGAAA